MKNDKIASSYISTTQAAHRLGLSVGTVQRMVEAGVLQAYTTQGGHRRILSSSLNHYCRGALDTSKIPIQVCVLTAPERITAALPDLSQIQELQLITNPLDLVGIKNKVGVMFLDARLSWLPWQELHIADSLGSEARCVIFNSNHLPQGSQTALESQATLYPGDVSADLIQGYLLGSAVGLHTQSAAATAPASDALGRHH